MKYKKLMAKIFAHNDRNNAQVGFALVAGLAIGAVLAVLFAPESGSDARRSISNKAKHLGGDARDLYGSLKGKITGHSAIDETIEEEHPSIHASAKRPKSDIKELIHEAHVNGAHTEEKLS